MIMCDKCQNNEDVLSGIDVAVSRTRMFCYSVAGFDLCGKCFGLLEKHIKDFAPKPAELVEGK